MFGELFMIHIIIDLVSISTGEVTDVANECVFIVDDDPDICEILELYLKKNGYTVFSAEDGISALSMLEERKPDLIVLDVMIPGLDGFELCQAIRRKSDVPIIFLSAKDSDMDKIVGLSIGGDDFVTKPISPAVLVAIIKAHLRRSRVLPKQQHEENSKPANFLEFPGLLIDQESCVVKVNQSIVSLPVKEFQLLCLLAQNPERVYSVDLLFEIIWGEQSFGDHRTVMVHISNLRRKIESNTDHSYIQTLRGIGYKFSVSKRH